MEIVHPRVGEPVLHQGQRCHIKAILDITRCLVQPDAEGTRPRPANLQELRPVPEAIPTRGARESVDLSGVPDKALAEAHRRLGIIRPLLVESSRHQVEETAREHGQHPATLYRWMQDYRRTGMVISLVPQFNRRGGPLKSRLVPELESLVREVIEDFYLTSERPSTAEAAREVEMRCRKRGIKPPTVGTVRNRILALSARLVTRERLGKKAANRFLPLLGSLPGANRPWDIVHVDHTKLDVILVDRETRQPMGRAWITLAEDAATRVIVGFHISLDAPSALSVGLCVSQAMLPKENWLACRGILGDWPVWGKPNTIHVDNAKEFRGKMLQRACEEMEVNIHFRRAGTPRDGGRIERLIGTLGRELHRLPGTTFSNPVQRGEYNSEKEAALTLDELERFVADWIVNVYHAKPHRSLGGRSPIKAWEDGLLGDGNLPGTGVPPRRLDEESVRLRFLPYVERTIQPYGVVLDDVMYWSDHLRHWIGAREPGKSKESRRFMVRRDPRDITRVWLYDPQLREHIELPYRDVARPSMSLWELRAVRQRLREEGCNNINEDLIFEARERLKILAEQSIKDTKATRRERERAARRQESASQTGPASKTHPLTTEPDVGAGTSVGADAQPRRSASSLAFDEIEF